MRKLEWFIAKGRKKLFSRGHLDALLFGLLSLVAIMLITSTILYFNLYPRIPNISLVYLLVILLIVRKYGFFVSTLFAVVICFFFDFFLIPPRFTLTVGRIEEGFALLLFLLVAMAISFSWVQWRKSVLKASNQEREIRVVYETVSYEYAKQLKRREFQVQALFQLIGAINSEKDLKHQLNLITENFISISSLYGILACSILSPDPDKDGGELVLQASAPGRGHWAELSHDEEICAKQVATNGQPILVPGGFQISRKRSNYIRNIVRNRTSRDSFSRRDTHFLPLKGTEQVLGVLRLIIDNKNDTSFPLPLFEQPLEASDLGLDSQAEFFGKLCDLAVSVIERANLESEKLRRRTQKLQDAIISSVSHSLRTPLATIMGMTTNLLQADIPWEDAIRRTASLQSIKSESERLNRLVAKLLDMSCIQGGKLEPRKVFYPVEALICETLVPGYIQKLLEGRNIALDIALDLPAVELDPDRIGQVLENLLENAAHYTPTGSPIEIHAQTRSDSILIGVADRGPGIRPADRERIFDKFCRGTVTYPLGTGIGLTVCRGLIEAHGGSIWAENRTDGGALFQFTLPRSKEYEL